jgi:hypothetical protein
LPGLSTKPVIPAEARIQSVAQLGQLFSGKALWITVFAGITKAGASGGSNAIAL